MATGGVDGNGNPNAYNDPNPVPIGAVVNVIITSGNVQANWKGGTTYSSYPLGAANSTAPPSMNPTQNVITTGSNYTFIADANPRTYTITATAGAGSSTITFTTYGPTGSLTQVSQGTANFYQNGSDPNGNTNMTIVSYDNSTTQQPPLNAGMYLKGQATESPLVGGNLMFFQTITAQRTVKFNSGGKSSGTWSGNGQVAADDGSTEPANNPNNNPALIGYPTTMSNPKATPPTYETSWPCPVGNAVVVRYMADRPYIDLAIADLPNLLQIGTTDQNNNPVPESFFTYLMFQGNGGSCVWVPIAQLNWSWSITATNNNGNWGVTNQTAPAASPPANPPAFGPFFTTTYASSQWNYQ